MIIRVAPLYVLADKEPSNEGRYAFDALDLAFNRPLNLREEGLFDYFDVGSIRHRFHSKFAQKFLAQFTEEDVPGILGFVYRALEQKKYLGLSQEDPKLMETIEKYKNESCTLELKERKKLLKNYEKHNAVERLSAIREETPWMLNSSLITIRERGFEGTLNLEDVTINMKSVNRTRFGAQYRLSDYALAPWRKSDNI